jgi:hypothetical protein
MNENESVPDWACEQFGAVPSPELMDLCHRFSFVIMAVVSDPELWFRLPRLDLVRLVVQAKLLDFAAHVAALDRQGVPNFFGTVKPEIGYTPVERRPDLPSRSWIKRNGKH